MKRIVRNLSPTTKEKISSSMKNRAKSEETRKKISDGMKKYWSTIPTANPEAIKDNKEKNNPNTKIPTL